MSFTNSVKYHPGKRMIFKNKTHFQECSFEKDSMCEKVTDSKEAMFYFLTRYPDGMAQRSAHDASSTHPCGSCSELFRKNKSRQNEERQTEGFKSPICSGYDLTPSSHLSSSYKRKLFYWKEGCFWSIES